MRRKLKHFLTIPDLPSGYTELEYLESIGTTNQQQHIDTGIVPQTDTRLFIDVEIVSILGGVNSLFGCRNESGTSMHFFDAYFNTTVGKPMAGGLRPYKMLTCEFPAGRFTASFTGSEVIVNGEVLYKYTPSYIKFDTAKTFLLFAMNYKYNVSQWSAIKVYSFKLSDPNGDLLDFVPVLNADGTPGMFDKVSRKFFPNNGTGQFKYKIKSA